MATFDYAMCQNRRSYKMSNHNDENQIFKKKKKIVQKSP
jgi:hypothetical protein